MYKAFESILAWSIYSVTYLDTNRVNITKGSTVNKTNSIYFSLFAENSAYHTYEVDGVPLDNYNVNFRSKRQADTQIAPVVNINNAPTPTPTVTINSKLLPKDVETPLLGANGTGQRKDYSIQKPTQLLSDAKPTDSEQTTSYSTVASVGKPSLGKTLDKSFASPSPGSAGISTINDDDDDIVDRADIPMEAINTTISKVFSNLKRRIMLCYVNV